MSRIIDIILREPWAITESALEHICLIAERKIDEAALDGQAVPFENERAVTVQNGVAVIPIIGPVMRYGNMFTRVSGATSIDILTRNVKDAVNDPSVRAIVLTIDSPGGEVNGTNELAQTIYEARQKKRIVCYVGYEAASAAYWMASAASEIVIDPTASLGSIGVVAGYYKRNADTDTVEFLSSQSPNKRVDPESGDGAALIQAHIDELADVFVDTVARNRAVSRDKVLADFGQGFMLVGASAVSAGLADRLGSFDALLAELGLPSSTPYQRRATTPAIPQLAAVASPQAMTLGMNHTPTHKEIFGMADDLITSAVDAPDAPVAPPFIPPIALSAETSQAQIDAYVKLQQESWEKQQAALLEQANAQFARRIAEMETRQSIQSYAQSVTTPTLSRPHALPLDEKAVIELMTGLPQAKRDAVKGALDRILEAGLVSFEELGSSAAGETERDVAAEYNQAVNAKIGTGMGRNAAIQAVAKEQPDLFEAYRHAPKGVR